LVNVWYKKCCIGTGILKFDQFKEGPPMELLYTDDLVFMAETEELLVEKMEK